MDRGASRLVLRVRDHASRTPLLLRVVRDATAVSKAICFVIPAHGRIEKTRVCLRQLARTCEQLDGLGFEATAVVVADDENLDSAGDAGFHAVRRPNSPLGRKWNDGYEFAGVELDADFVVPLGSDDWVDPIIFSDLPEPHEIRCHRMSSIVREDGARISALNIWYEGGDGVRIFPRSLLEMVRFRPAENDRNRAIDTSIMQRLQRFHLGELPPRRYFDANPYQIVDWKTPGDQLNTYHACVAYRSERERDTWETLTDRYPREALDEMKAVYGVLV